MMNDLSQYWWILLIVVALILVLLLRPRQRVALTDSTPTRPHMTAPSEGKGLAAEAAAAIGDVGGEIVGAPVHAKLGAVAAAGDDLLALKGVGPKLAETLRRLGFTRYEQIAGLSENEVERLDAQLGAFRGRLKRDRIVEQADYLARGDRDGFEQRFGKL